MINFYTIGVYGVTEDEFFKKLQENNIDTFVDIRQRRAVRGSKYKFVNSKYLQQKLGELGIRYRHIIELAPTKEIRQQQSIADKESNIKKRDRSELSIEFIDRFESQILGKYDFQKFIDDLLHLDTKNAVFFCVEQTPKACHRSLVTERLSKEYVTNYLHI